MSSNLGNVAGIVVSDNPPVEADGNTVKTYVLWAKPVGQSFDLSYHKRETGTWLPLDPTKIINDDVSTQSLVEVLSKSKVLSLIQGFLSTDSIIDNLTSNSTNNPLSAEQGKILKGLIDEINTILNYGGTSLDPLQSYTNNL